MLTAVTYNCDPDSLADVAPADFADAFENEVRVRPIYRDVAVTVTFEPGPSGVATFASDDPDADLDRDDEYRAEFDRFAERAFAACLAA